MPRLRTLLIATAVLLLSTGCGETGEPHEIDEQQEQDDTAEHRDYKGPIGGDRPVEPIFPDDYDVEGNHPLLILLHGLGSDADETIAGFDVDTRASNRGLVILAPKGTKDSRGDRFWNATESCCDFENTGVDDVGYLTDLIDEAVERYAVDPERVFLMGISNGAMMSHRMACDRGERVRSIASFNGSSTPAAEDCDPDAATDIIHIHATEDELVPYEGNTAFPAATEVVERWADWNDCDPDPVEGPSVNVTAAVEGDETTIEYWQSCRDGGDVELWTMHGAGHVPLPLADFPELILDTLLGE